MRLSVESPLLLERHLTLARVAAECAKTLPFEGADILAVGREAVAGMKRARLFHALVPSEFGGVQERVEALGICAIRA